MGEGEGTLRPMVKVLARSCLVALPSTPLSSRPAIGYGPVNCVAVFRLVVIISFLLKLRPESPVVTVTWHASKYEVLPLSGSSSVAERRNRDGKVAGSSAGRSGGIMFVVQGQTFCATLIAVSVPPPCYRSST